MHPKTKAPAPEYTPNWLESLDGRTGIAQQLRHRYACMTSDLGGEEHLSYMQRSLVTRALHLEYFLELEETKLRNGGGADFDSGKWAQANNALQGILSKLGLQRQAREVSIGEFVKARQK